MGIFSKLLNPFSWGKLGGKLGGKSKDNYKPRNSKVPSRPPSELLLYARDIAGCQIQKLLYSTEGASWMRASYTYPSFDDMNFIIKDNIFSIIIDIQDEEGFSYLPEEFKKRQLFAAKKYNLIPCKFPVVVNNPHNPDMNTVRAKTDGWNLLSTDLSNEIVPDTETCERTEVSDWEYRHLSIMYIINYLKQKKMNILSFQDTLEVDPQIWFEDSNKKQCWLIVRTSKIDQSNIKKPKALKEIIKKCFTKDGYYALVSFEVEDEYKKRLYRGDKYNISIKEFEKIHTTL